MRRFGLLALGCIGAACGAAAAPGDLDPAFGTNGMVRLGALGSDPLATDDTASGGLAIPADGKLLVLSPGGVWRLNPDGTLDQSFGAGGKTLAPPGNSTNSVLQLADGKIATGGSVVQHTPNASDMYELAVTRLLSDGRPDLAFGVLGRAAVDLSMGCCVAGAARALALLEQRDGKLVAAGSVAYASWDSSGGNFEFPDLLLSRFDTAGSLDPSFGGSGGTVLLHTTDWVTPGGKSAGGKFALGGELLGLAEQADGALVAAGFMETQLAVARFSADGVLDPTFGRKGVVTLQVGPAGAAAIASAVAVQSDGKIVVAGRTRFDCDLDDPSCKRIRQGVVARFNADGTLDASFGTGGIVLLDAGELETEITQGGLALEPSGRVVIGGNTEPPDGSRYAFVARLTAAGVLDANFGNAGVTLVDTGGGYSAPGGEFGGLARTATGALTVAATNPTDNPATVVAQLAASGGHPGVIGLSKAWLNVGEGSDARFVVRRTGGTQGTVSVEYSTQLYAPDPWSDAGPTADAADFQAESGTLTWADGNATDRTIAIPLTMDMVVEPNESFGFELSNVSGGAALATTEGGVLIIDVNANAGELQFAADAVTAPEGAFAVLDVTRTGGSTGAVDVYYGTVSGSAYQDVDFSGSNGTLHWDNDDTSPKPVVVAITPEASAQLGETFSVWLHDPSGGATLGNVKMATVTIVAAPPTPVSNASGGGGSLGLLDVLWLGLVTLAARAARVHGGRARSAGQARVTCRRSTIQQFGLLTLGCIGAAFGAAAAPGDLDSAFGTNGMARLDALGSDPLAADDAAGGGLAIQADGKLLVLRPGGVWRMNPDGTLDQSFGAGGKTLAPPGNSTNSVLELADGKIATGGSVVDQRTGIDIYKLAVTRLLSDGRTDLAFGVAGQATVNRSCCAARALALLEQGDGKIVAAGWVAYGGQWDYGDFGTPALALLRFDAAGSLDASFGGSGGTVSLYTTDWVTPGGKFASGGELLGLAQQADGALVAAGFMETQLAVARFTSEGVLDPTFGGTGVVTLQVGPVGAVALASAVAVQSDGKIVVAGRTRFDCDLDDPSCKRVRQAIVARFNADGTLDASFSTGGVALLDAGEAYTEITQGGLALDPSGRIVVGGNTEAPDGPHYTFVARLTAAGALDSGFGTAGVTLIDTGHGSSASGGGFGGLARTATGALTVAATDPTADSATVVAQLADSGSHPGVIGLTKTELTADEGSDARVVVRRTGGTQGTVSVDYATYAPDPWSDPGPAADAADFQAESGTLTWPDGDATERTIAIPVTMDLVVEDNEWFGLQLSNVGGGATLAATDGTVWIADVNRNAGELQFSAADLTVSERSFAVLNVTRTGGSTGAVDVPYGKVSGSADKVWDFDGSDGTLHWANGDTSPKSIRFSINIDGEAEPNETFSVRLHDPSGGATLGSVSTVTVTILDVPPDSPPSPPSPGPVAGAPTLLSPNPSTSGGGGSLGLLDVLWLSLVTLAARAARLNGGRARSAGQARAAGRS